MATLKTVAHGWRVVGRGLNGWHAKGANVSSSGGTFEHYLRDAGDGALVYDAAGAEVEAFSKFVYTGPMVDPALEPGDWVKFWHHEAVAKALDTVGVDVYRELLRILPGVKLGTVAGGAVTWETDQTQPALPGAEDVRAQEVTLPAFELPAQSFTLTAPGETQPAQASLLSGWTMVDTSTEAAS